MNVIDKSINLFRLDDYAADLQIFFYLHHGKDISFLGNEHKPHLAAIPDR